MTKSEKNMTDTEKLLQDLTRMVSRADFRKPGAYKTAGNIVRAVSNYNKEVIKRNDGKLQPMSVLFTVEGRCVFIPQDEAGQSVQEPGQVDSVPKRAVVQPSRGQVEGNTEHTEVPEGGAPKEGPEDKEAGGTHDVTGAPV